MEPPAPRRRLDLVFILIVAAAARLGPVLFETPIGRDIIEYRNVAENIASGRGFTLDIKSYYQVPTDVSHYSGYDRPPLLPALLALMHRAMSPETAGRLVSPLLWLATVALVYGAARVRLGDGAAFWAALLVAVHPGLLEISLSPLSEATLLFCIALAWWGRERMKSPVLTGAACVLAFLARPSGAIVGVVFGVVYLMEAKRERVWRRPAVFALTASLGLVALVALNRVNDAPALQTPQDFLFKVRHFSEGQQFFHRAPVYETTAALWSEHGPRLARTVIKNGYYYLKALARPTLGLGFLLPLLPIAAIGLIRSRRFGPVAPLLVLGLLDLGLYTATWSTFDADRFLAVPILAAVAAFAAGVDGVDRVDSVDGVDGSERFGSRRLRGFASFVSSRLGSALLLTVALLYSPSVAMRGYLALREHQRGAPLSNNLEAIWGAPEVASLAAALREIDGRPHALRSTVVASNEPWLAHRLTGGPTAMIPFDRKDGEWIVHLTRVEASLATIVEGAWPPEFAAALERLRLELREAGWTRLFAEGTIELWSAP
jgi:hypothetical protein